MMRYAKERKESVIRKMPAAPHLPIPELARETGISCWTLHDSRKTKMKPASTRRGANGGCSSTIQFCLGLMEW